MSSQFNVVTENPPFTLSPEYVQREKAISDLIDSMRTIEDNLPPYEKRNVAEQCQIDLVHLIGPDLAEVFLEMFDSLKAVSEKRFDGMSIDEKYENHFREVNLLDALDRMIRVMVKLHDNGESKVADIERYGDIQGIDLINAITENLEAKLADESRDSFDYISIEEKFPPDLLSDIQWVIIGSIYYSRVNFNEAVHRHRLEICISGYWNPSMISILVPRIAIQCSDGDGNDFILDFESDNGHWFTDGELLFKIHNAMVEQCNECDHRFFEGLHFVKNQESGTPMYSLSIGS